MNYVLATLFGYYWQTSGDYIIMFVVSAFGFSVMGELIKKSIFPKLSSSEAESTEQKKCPKWLGLVIGAAWTAVFAVVAIIADRTGADRCQIVGGLYFFPITLVIYFAYQWAVDMLVKKMLRTILPKFMTGESSKGTKEKSDTEVYVVPKGAKIKRVDPDELS